MTSPKPAASRLAVLVDGTRLPDDEGRAFWTRFSAYMEEHKGDLGGFAASEGLASVHPEMRAEGAVLVASRSAAQKPYTNASSGGGSGVDPAGSTRGSGGPQAGGGNRGRGPAGGRKSKGKRR